MLLTFFDHLLSLLLDTAVWLLFGLLLAAILKGWIPETLVKRWLSGKGAGPVIRAAFIGAPLPLCSCGVLPTAIGLRRTGASKPATVSFLVATPETGVDSISVTYALLGPVMAIIRPVSALISAVVSGLMVLFFDVKETGRQATENAHCEKTETQPACCSKQELSSSCCSTTQPVETSGCCSEKVEPEASSCCNSSSCDSDKETRGIRQGIHFAVFDILDDISGWLAIGLILAAIVATLVEPASLSQWGSGLQGMLLMLIVGLPLYICATASTPLAAALLAAGMSPGAVLVFLLVGPATNIASLGILNRELGMRAVILYLTGISLCAILLGLTTNALLSNTALSLGSSDALHSGLFSVIQWLSAIILLTLAIKPVRKLVWRG